MATNLEYALMAGVAYRSTRNEINRFPIPTLDQRGQARIIFYAGYSCPATPHPC